MHRQAVDGAVRARAGTVRTTYLPGLDGVRALAVVAVLAYHFQVPPAIGGFLGVDIFFVLSGYLISSQLWARWSVRGVDLKAFWLGRIRRLFPAVLALIAVCLVAMLIAGRDQLQVFLGDVGAAATYTSNWWYVLHERSYFEAAGRPPVLQHLWSLAVEEQFYLLWPLVMYVVWRRVPRPRGRRTVLLATSLALAGLSALVMGVGSALTHTPELGDPSRWYFGTDSHAMGLLIGAALAFHRGGAGFGPLMPMLRPATRRASLVGVGATAALVAAICTVDEFSVPLYRVGFLLVAVVTVVLVSVVSRPGPVQRAFSLPLLRYLGQRSYGLYLWHWPVAAFTRPELDVPYSGLRLAVLRITLTLVLAELSLQFVEKPVRAHGWRRPWAGMNASFALVRLAAAQLVVGLTVAFAAPPGLALPDPHAPAALGSGPEAAEGPRAEAPRPTPSLSPAQVTPRKDLSLVVYGDSVAVGAEPAFVRFFGSVDNRAQVAEHSWNLLPALAADAKAGKVKADVVVLHTGDNGIIPAAQLRAALDALRGVTSVILVTPKVPRSWERRSVESVRTIGPEYPHVQIADWHTYASGHPEWFVADGIHLSSAGEEAYVRLILSRVTIPAPPAPPPGAPTPSPDASKR